MKKVLSFLPFFLSLCLIWLFWSTAVSSSWSRISSIQTIEPYAFAAHEQLMRNFSSTGQFAQTIHSGYDDKWTWSGHRALTLPIVAKLYGIAPSAKNLSALMISIIALGALPAGALCMRYMRSNWGFLFGAFAYLIAPPTMALSLQDYQDLCLALPCLIFAMWAFSTGKIVLVILGALVGIAAREECVPMTIAIAFLMVPYKKRRSSSWVSRQSPPRISWLRWFLGAFIGSLIAVTYIWFAEKFITHK